MIGLVWSVGVGLGHKRNIYFSTTRRNISHVCHSLVRFPDLLWDIHGRRGTWLVTHQLTDFSDYFALVAGARQRSLPSVLPRGGVGMGGCLCWGAHDCLHSGFNILFFSTLLLYFRESSCPLEFWWSQQSGGSGEAPASKFLREKPFFFQAICRLLCHAHQLLHGLFKEISHLFPLLNQISFSISPGF